MSVNYRENPEFRKNMRKLVAEGVDRASGALQTDLKRVLNRAGSPPPSAPGQPPHKATGDLGRSVQIDRSHVESDLKARVGTNKVYGRWLEYGTRIMAARPWMRPTTRKFKDKIARYFVGIK